MQAGCADYIGFSKHQPAAQVFVGAAPLGSGAGKSELGCTMLKVLAEPRVAGHCCFLARSARPERT
jgi:hypothetical protein